MFDGSVGSYDLVTDVLSWGLDRLWWRRAAAAIPAPSGASVLDVGCGTGSLSKRLAARFRVTGVDVSERMLEIAGRRLGPRVRLVRGSVFRMPFRDGAFEGVASSFVLRNLADLQAAFAEIARVTRAGSSIALVDITEPRGRVLRPLFDAYFRVAAPALGSLVGRRQTYTYLANSLPQLPPPDRVAALVEDAGFHGVRRRVLPPGAVTLWTGIRSS
jgi:demethylmenaquinone methyltransferase/2-methoxy-6-polyprenyl-1,4-benzoquinol methylase